MNDDEWMIINIINKFNLNQESICELCIMYYVSESTKFE